MNEGDEKGGEGILFCGDPHGDFRALTRVALERPDALFVLLGDLQPRRPLHEELASIRERVWFVHGNHDTDSASDFANVFECGMVDRNLHGRVVTLPNGTRVAGLGGVFRESVWYPQQAARFESMGEHARSTPRHDRWRDGPPRRHWSSIYPDVVKELAAQEADILVTHEAPSCHPLGHAIIDDLARAMRLMVVFHGHHHDRLDYAGRWDAFGFKVFGVGLGGVTGGDGVPVVPGELDLVRQYRRRLTDDEGT